LPSAAVFIVARTGSSRLPRKVLTPIHERPILARLVERARRAVEPDAWVLCTTTASSDDELAALGLALGLRVFRGSERDVPVRLRDAARATEAEFFVLLESDEIFADPEFIDAVIRRRLETGADYIVTRGLPIGAWVCGISRRAIEQLCADRATEAVDGWGVFLERDARLRTESVHTDSALAAASEGLRLTLDYPEDLEVISAVFDRLRDRGDDFSVRDVVALLTAEPELAAPNRKLNEQYWQRIEKTRQS